MVLLLVILVAACLALGAALLALGVRGRRVDDHPLCSACRFDLVGVYPGGAPCPECGSDLGGPRAIRVGNQRRSRGLIIGAAPLLAVALGGGGFLGWAGATGTNWCAPAPSWLLEELASWGGSASPPAISELAIRVGAGELEPGRSARLVERALALQADRSRPWTPEWGDLLDAAMGAGLLGEEQIRSYATNACDFELELRDRLRAGDRVAVQAWIRPVRAGRSTSMVLKYTLGAIRLDGEPLPGPTGGESMAYVSGIGSAAGMTRHHTIDGPPGQHVLGADIHATVAFGSFGTLAGGAFPTEGSIELDRTVSLPIELVPPGTQVVSLVADPELRPVIAERIEPSGFRASARGEGATELHGSLMGRDLPIDCAFEVFVRVDGREHRWGVAVFPRGQEHGMSSSSKIPATIGDTVDLVFRATEDVVRTQTNLASAWEGEIVIEDVPVAHAIKPDE